VAEADSYGSIATPHQSVSAGITMLNYLSVVEVCTFLNLVSSSHHYFCHYVPTVQS